MIHYAVRFWNVQTGRKEYREYPKIGQFKNHKSLCDFLEERTFLIANDGWIVDEIKEYNPIKSKLELADKLGQLIYSKL
jgi:hypothetical protein